MAKLTEADITLIRQALTFFVWAGGEGISPLDETPEPETSLFEYATATGDEDYDSYADAICRRAALSGHDGGGK